MVWHLVVGHLSVTRPRVRLGPRANQLLAALRVVDKHHAATGGHRVAVGLVTPEVEDRHIARSVGPAEGREERGEGVELEVDIEPHNGLVQHSQLLHHKDRLHRDKVKSESIRALHGGRTEGIGGKELSTAARVDVVTGGHKALGLGLEHRRVQGDADKVVVLDARAGGPLEVITEGHGRHLQQLPVVK